MKLIISSDHGGFELKEKIKKYLISKEFEVEDMGTNSEESCDYPEFAVKVAEKVAGSDDKGILICGTGIGMSMAANKVKGIRAALCHNEYTAKMAREHNDANILCMGARVIDNEMAKKIVDIFLNTDVSEEERHNRRVNKIMDVEKE